jgi:hypothetical protein
VLATKLLRAPPTAAAASSELKADSNGASAKAAADSASAATTAAVPPFDSPLPALFAASNIAGGLQAWSRHVDPDFPVYWLGVSPWSLLCTAAAVDASVREGMCTFAKPTHL